MTAMRINLSVTSADPEIITRSIEAFGRSMAGLALEGVDTFLIVTADDDGDES